MQMRPPRPYAIEVTTQYKKGYKRMAKQGLDMRLLDAVVWRLAMGEPLEHRYKDHALKGKYAGYRECHIKPDWLLIYTIRNDILILTLVDTGTHADLFDK